MTLSRLNGSELRVRSREHYLKALLDVGFDAIPVDAGSTVPDEFDALCLTGGEDMEPSRTAPQADPKTEPADAKRDALELALVATARERDLPVLGICRGFQVINVAYGGSLVQHVDGHREANGPIVRTRGRDGRVEARGCLRRRPVQRQRTPPSGGHRAVPCARAWCRPRTSMDSSEAFEDPAQRWLVAVQWHPERSADPDMSAAGTRIFGAFADAAARQPARAR